MSHYLPAIISAAQKAQQDHSVPASVSLAQFAIESGYGKHMPIGSYNAFGIKAVSGQPSVTARTREVIHGKTVYVDAQFRKFADFNEAFEEHAKLLSRPLYADAMHAWKVDHDLERGVRLMAHKYATDPNYATVILSVIHSQNLQQYDA